MWKYLAALVLLLTIGVVGAQMDTPKLCDVCYANIITQTDTQTIEDVALGVADQMAEDHTETVGAGNEGLSAAIIVTPKFADPETGSMFAVAPFSRIDQEMHQTISGLGNVDEDGTPITQGAKGLTWNKAIQAAWIANQGVKELEYNETSEAFEYVKEGSYIAQSTTQDILDIYEYSSREGAKILNLDNKVAMIVDDLEIIINLTARADTASIDNQTSIGAIYNDVNVTVAAKDP